MRRRYQPDEWYRDFGHRLRVSRILLGLTEEKAAAAAGRTVTTWRRYEATGMGNITGPILLFSERFNINLDWLFCGEGGGVRAHSYQNVTGKIAILPTSGRQAVKAAQS
jgi:transcriptional regulator with XRE-family HTH domain